MASSKVPELTKQLNNIKEQFDSLANADSLHCEQLDSIQKAMNDSIAHYHDLINNLTAGEQTGMDIDPLWLILCLAAIALAWLWIKKRKKNMRDNKIVYDAESQRAFLDTSKEDASIASAGSSPCIAAVASDTRKSKNQDSYCEAYVEKAKARIIAVADGVGSSYKAEEGSRFVAAKAVALVKEAIDKDEHHIDFDTIFDQVQAGLNAKIEADFADELPNIKQSSFGTTLIIGIDFPDRFVTAYVGNGSIWHVSGLFNSFPQMVSLPWNAVNLLTPDTIMSGGKEALYKIFFYKGEKKHHKPTVLQLSKLNEAPGDMFIITTDGVYSSDHAIAGKDDEGDIWIPSTPQFGLLHDALKAYVEGDEDINDDTLHQTLVRYLAHINEAKIMDDDTTVGVFISPEAKRHFMDKRKKDETD